MTGNGADAATAGRGAGPVTGGPSPVLLASLGAASISASAVLIKLAVTGVVTAAFYRCLLALPVLAALAVVEQRRRGPRTPVVRRGAGVHRRTRRVRSRDAAPPTARPSR